MNKKEKVSKIFFFLPRKKEERIESCKINWTFYSYHTFHFLVHHFYDNIILCSKTVSFSSRKQSLMAQKSENLTRKKYISFNIVRNKQTKSDRNKLEFFFCFLHFLYSISHWHFNAFIILKCFFLSSIAMFYFTLENKSHHWEYWDRRVSIVIAGVYKNWARSVRGISRLLIFFFFFLLCVIFLGYGLSISMNIDKRCFMCLKWFDVLVWCLLNF